MSSVFMVVGVFALFPLVSKNEPTALNIILYIIGVYSIMISGILAGKKS